MRSIASIAGDARPRTDTRERHAVAQPSKHTHNAQATDAAVADATQAVADTTIEEAPKKPEIKIVKTTSDAPVVENACDEKWTSAELAAKCCDTMVAAGKLRATPAFISEDREAKLVKIFEGAKLDGAKVLACKNARELEVIIRNATEGEGWVDHVQSAMKTFLPADVQTREGRHDGERGGEEGQGGLSYEGLGR